MRAIVVCTALLIPALVSPVSADWEHIGPAGGAVTYILQSSTDSDVLYAFAGLSMSYDIVKSVNDGDSWNPTGGGIDEYNIAVLANSTGASEFHLSGRRTIESQMIFRRKGISMGGSRMISEYSTKFADADRIRTVIKILEGIEI